MQRMQFVIEVPDDYMIHEVGNDIQNMINRSDNYDPECKVVDQRVL